MLRLAETRDVVRVVDDQYGAPTAAIDLGRAIVDALVQVLEREARGRAGIYHVTASGETTGTVLPRRFLLVGAIAAIVSLSLKQLRQPIIQLV